MPGFDRTGPRGEGPMTGGGRGLCNSYGSGYGRPYGFYGVGRGGMPWGGGRGRAWGGGRGRGRGFGRAGFGGWDYPYANPVAPGPSEDDEKRYLADQMSALEDELRAIKERLAELDKKK